MYHDKKSLVLFCVCLTIKGYSGHPVEKCLTNDASSSITKSSFNEEEFRVQATNLGNTIAKLVIEERELLGKISRGSKPLSEASYKPISTSSVVANLANVNPVPVTTTVISTYVGTGPNMAAASQASQEINKLQIAPAQHGAQPVSEAPALTSPQIVISIHTSQPNPYVNVNHPNAPQISCQAAPLSNSQIPKPTSVEEQTNSSTLNASILSTTVPSSPPGAAADQTDVSSKDPETPTNTSPSPPSTNNDQQNGSPIKPQTSTNTTSSPTASNVDQEDGSAKVTPPVTNVQSPAAAPTINGTVGTSNATPLSPPISQSTTTQTNEALLTNVNPISPTDLQNQISNSENPQSTNSTIDQPQTFQANQDPAKQSATAESTSDITNAVISDFVQVLEEDRHQGKPTASHKVGSEVDLSSAVKPSDITADTISDFKHVLEEDSHSPNPLAVSTDVPNQPTT